MIDPRLFLLVPVVFIAFVLKGLTGFGPGIVIVPVAALVIGARDAVVLIGILDLASNSVIVFRDRATGKHRFWLPMAIAMVAGSGIGGILLKLVPPVDFTILLAVMIAVVGLWFLSGRRTANRQALRNELPSRVGLKDLAVALAAGIFGGFFGMAGLLIAWYLGSFLSKEMFRQVIVHILLLSAITRVITYAVAGLLTLEVFWLSAAAFPLLLTGLYLGGGVLIRISESWFSRVIGVVLLASAARMFL